MKRIFNHPSARRFSSLNAANFLLKYPEEKPLIDLNINLEKKLLSDYEALLTEFAKIQLEKSAIDKKLKICREKIEKSKNSLPYRPTEGEKYVIQTVLDNIYYHIISNQQRKIYTVRYDTFANRCNNLQKIASCFALYNIEPIKIETSSHYNSFDLLTFTLPEIQNLPKLDLTEDLSRVP